MTIDAVAMWIVVGALTVAFLAGVVGAMKGDAP